jgi:ABC-type uncharacterized transport system involved in gliding motility auxiliary subunit
MSWLSKISKSKLSWIALGLGAIILSAVNLIGWESLKLYRLDVTENKLFTLTDSTRKVIAEVDDPITLKLYYTDALGARAPAYGLYATRIQALLKHYSSLSNGKIVFQKISPEPFSDEEDRAVAAGLTAIPLGTSAQKGYLALVGSNSTDDEENIAFMTLERSAFLEYDLTRIVHKLSKPARKNVGLITGLDMRGAMGANGRPVPAWLIMSQLEEFFNVRALKRDARAIDPSIDALLVVAPDKLSDELAFAIDQFALSGKPVVVFADPYVEVNRREQTGLAKNTNLVKLLAGWGANIVTDKVVGDPQNSRRIQFNSATQPVIVNYIVWMNYDKKSFDTDDAIFSNVKRLVMATAGALSANKQAGTKFTALLKTKKDSSLIATDLMVPPNPIKLINSFNPDGKEKVLVARLSGTAQASIVIGKQSKPGQKFEGNINVIVVSDADMLFDSFWAQARNAGGQQVIVPMANNQDLLLNALENLSGGGALSGLRGRGVENRPFKLINAMQRQAESRFRKRERVLNDKLKQAQKKLTEINTRAGEGEVILSDEDKGAILKIRSEVVATRRDLRQVQSALSKDIKQLQFWVQMANTIGIPLVILFGAAVWNLSGRKRKKPGASA